MRIIIGLFSLAMWQDLETLYHISLIECTVVLNILESFGMTVSLILES